MNETRQLGSTLMTVEEVARHLHISRAQGYRLIRESGFPLIELGPRILRVNPQGLQRWLDDKVAA